MFEHLFKFSLVSLREGEIGFQYGRPELVLVLIGIVILVLAAIYATTNRYTSNRQRAISYTLRALALLALCFPLLEPVLVTPDVIPKENFVAVLIDDSESMLLRDGTGGVAREEEARAIVSKLAPDLQKLFKVRYYTFSGEARRIGAVDNVQATGLQTNLSTALDRVLNDFDGLPLSGVVVLTDGADNSREVPMNKAEAFRDRGIPLHFVGLGRERFEADRELLEVAASRGVEETTGAEIDVKVRSWAREPEPVNIHIYRDSQLVRTETRALKGDGNVDQFTFFYEPETPGVAAYTVEIEPAAREANTANNRLGTLIDTKQDSIRVLYFEGHLRPDFKHVKRALEVDRAVTFTSVARTGIGKYYRQGIASPQELSGGFPTSEEELFKYRAIIFGDVEASTFSPEQLAMIERFGRIRGGGFLMMGGLNSFAEGNYWNTPVAEMLPVELDPGRRTTLPPDFSREGQPPVAQGFKFVPTEAGLENPILKLSPDPESNRLQWVDLPGLTSINYLGAVKPGALVLAEKPDDEFGDGEPLLVIQRYGRGRSAALATAGTWRWQMLLEADDQRYERFWRQLVRWLVASTPTAVNIDETQPQFTAGEVAPLTVTVFDRMYNPKENATVTGSLTSASGKAQPVQFLASLSEPGRYEAEFEPMEPGLYELHVTATEGATVVGDDVARFLVRPAAREYYDATLKQTLLADLAQTSNGVYYRPSEVSRIPDNLRYRKSATSVYQAEMLWDMPFLYGLVLVLLSIEWIYRRRKGLP